METKCFWWTVLQSWGQLINRDYNHIALQHSLVLSNCTGSPLHYITLLHQVHFVVYVYLQFVVDALQYYIRIWWGVLHWTTLYALLHCIALHVALSAFGGVCLSAAGRGQGDLDLATSWHPLTNPLVQIMIIMVRAMMLVIMVISWWDHRQNYQQYWHFGFQASSSKLSWPLDIVPQCHHIQCPQCDHHQWIVDGSRKPRMGAVSLMIKFETFGRRKRSWSRRWTLTRCRNKVHQKINQCHTILHPHPFWWFINCFQMWNLKHFFVKTLRWKATGVFRSLSNER